jgi:hypothetical protein
MYIEPISINAYIRLFLVFLQHYKETRVLGLAEFIFPASTAKQKPKCENPRYGGLKEDVAT